MPFLAGRQGRWFVNRFNAPRPRFGRQPQAADSLPAPALRRGAARRPAMLAEAAAVLDVLPGPSLHGLMPGRYDLMHRVAAAIGKLGTCSAVRVATRSYNRRNLAELPAQLDRRRVRSLTLLCSAFVRDPNRDLWGRPSTSSAGAAGGRPRHGRTPR